MINFQDAKDNNDDSDGHVKGGQESMIMLISRYTVAFAPEKHVLTNDHGLVVIR